MDPSRRDTRRRSRVWTPQLGGRHAHPELGVNPSNGETRPHPAVGCEPLKEWGIQGGAGAGGTQSWVWTPQGEGGSLWSRRVPSAGEDGARAPGHLLGESARRWGRGRQRTGLDTALLRSCAIVCSCIYKYRIHPRISHTLVQDAPQFSLRARGLMSPLTSVSR